MYAKKSLCAINTHFRFSGCKWTLQQLRQHIRQAGVNDWLLWQKISVLVSLTLASQCTGIPSTSNCFELYGFDILVDSNLKPWLLEVQFRLINIKHTYQFFKSVFKAKKPLVLQRCLFKFLLSWKYLD